MEASPVYIVVSILVLAQFAVLIWFPGRGKPEKGLSKLAALSFACIIAGIIFGENRLVGYSLLGIGVLCAIVDIYYKRTCR